MCFQYFNFYSLANNIPPKYLKAVERFIFLMYNEFESVQAVYNWQKGRSLPSLENLMVLSELFDEAIEGILIYE